MRKIYFLAILLIAFSANAQFEIDFDDMSLGDVSPQSEHIVLWPAAGVTDAQVTNEQAFSGTNSIVMREQPGNNTFDDILVNVGNKTSGTWSVTWMMYIPSGKVGFWNIQEHESVSPVPHWNGQFFAGLTASGGSIGEITFDQNPNVFASYPDNEWFSVVHVIDLDNSTNTTVINGNTLLDAAPYQGAPQGGTAALSTQLGSINFYSIDTNNRYYIDDFKLIEGNVLSTNDFETEAFSVYPNPVGNQLNIKSNDAVSDVAIYNVLGSLVHRSAPNAVSPSIDMSSFKSGVYFVEVTINNSRKTVKIVK
jgi:hypothetical protein